MRNIIISLLRITALLLILPFKGSAQESSISLATATSSFKAVINPSTSSIILVKANGKTFPVSFSNLKHKIADLKFTKTNVSWYLPKQRLKFEIALASDYLDVDISTDSISGHNWPITGKSAEAFTIPFGEGKYIPSGDRQWIEYLRKKGDIKTLEQFTMQFFAINFKQDALVYIIKNRYNNTVNFRDKDNALELEFTHQFPKTVKEKKYGFRIYLTENNMTKIAKTYKKYVNEISPILTLEEKAKKNPNIRKLYGAPHIYVWNTGFFKTKDIIDWKGLKAFILTELKAKNNNPTKLLLDLFKKGEYGREFLASLEDFKNNDWISKYEQQLLVNSWNEALLRPDLYDEISWKSLQLHPETLALIKKIKSTDFIQADIYRLNSLLFKQAYASFTTDIDTWGGFPASRLGELKKSGIENAWLGLSDDWVQGQIHLDFLTEAKNKGYLIGPYDSYHSVHKPGEEKWLTAKFDDTTVYYNSYVKNADGSTSEGFLGVGRNVNPTLIFPVVKRRVESVLRNSNFQLNSWFMDCDATGEFFDDYTADHITNQQQDERSRMDRMAWIRDAKQLIIGSEGGNDFAVNTLAFAHGLVTPFFGDKDMHDKNSKYFTGSYFSPSNAIPERYIKLAPIKEEYQYTIFNNSFNVPLYQLVYNNAIIPTHHWEWGSLKVAEEAKNTAIREILYNVPPLYHLNNEQWELNKDTIAKHVKAFVKTHKKAIRLEMDTFEWLTADHLVQRTKFENALEIIANFSKQQFIYKKQEVPATSLLIHDLKTDSYEIYIP